MCREHFTMSAFADLSGVVYLPVRKINLSGLKGIKNHIPGADTPQSWGGLIKFGGMMK
jgi:hypothetical protein